MSVQQADLCRAWGLSRARVSQLKKAGMPLTSFAEAEAWRAAHFPGSTKNGGSGGKEKSTPENKEGAVLPDPPEPVKESDLNREDFIGTLARLKKNEMLAWGMLATAVADLRKGVGSETEVMTRERQYKDAVGLRVQQESKVDEILLRRRDLITTEEAKELFGRHLQSLRMALKTVPARLSARCNPSDPELAKAALGEAVDRIFKTMNDWEV
jgi:hypothetical protein